MRICRGSVFVCGRGWVWVCACVWSPSQILIRPLCGAGEQRISATFLQFFHRGITKIESMNALSISLSNDYISVFKAAARNLNWGSNWALGDWNWDSRQFTSEGRLWRAACRRTKSPWNIQALTPGDPDTLQPKSANIAPLPLLLDELAPPAYQ